MGFSSHYVLLLQASGGSQQAIFSFSLMKFDEFNLFYTFIRIALYDLISVYFFRGAVNDAGVINGSSHL